MELIQRRHEGMMFIGRYLTRGQRNETERRKLLSINKKKRILAWCGIMYQAIQFGIRILLTFLILEKKVSSTYTYLLLNFPSIL